MTSKNENIKHRLRSRSVSRGHTGSRSSSRGRSKSPGRRKSVDQKRSSLSKVSLSQKSFPKSPKEQSQHIMEKTLDEAFPVQNGRKVQITDGNGMVKDQPVVKLLKSCKPDKIQVFESKSVKGDWKMSLGGGIVNAALMVFSLAVVLLVGLSCPLKYCNVDAFPVLPRNLAYCVDMEASLVVTGWVVFQFLLSLIPVGGCRLGQPLKATGKRLMYRCNGLFALLVNGFALSLMIYFKFPVHDWVYEKFLPIAVSASTLAILFSALLYIRALHLPREKVSCFEQNSNFFTDFYLGRELNPQVFKVDLKFFFIMNIGYISWSCLGLVVLFEAYHKDSWNGSLVMVAGFQAIYILHSLLFQGSVVTTMMMLNEGLGFKLIFTSMAWQPFVSSIHLRFLCVHPSALDLPLASFLSIILFLSGIIIFHCSSYQKDLFQQNPHHSDFSGLNVIPSDNGQSLLCTYWWRICRHPNYFGILLMVVAWSLPCGLDCPLTYVIPLFTLLSCLFRIHIVESFCETSHGVAWKRYTQKVTSRLIPWIY